MMLPMIEVYRAAGVRMLPTQPLVERPRGTSLAGELVLAPPSARGTPWMRRLGDLSDALASGLMRVRGVRRQRAYDRGFVLSDHADWPAAARHHRRDRRRPRARHARPCRAAGALPARAGPRRRRHAHGVGRRGRRRRPRMIRFAALFAALDSTNATNAKVEAIARYLAGGARRRRRVGGVLPHRPPPEAPRPGPRRSADWTMAATGLSDWLLGECYAVVGDGAETAALILDRLPSAPAPDAEPRGVGRERASCRCATPSPSASRQQVIALDRRARSLGAVHAVQAAHAASSASASRRRWSCAPSRRRRRCRRRSIAARLTGDWTPTAEWYRSLVAADVTDADRSRPYPFFLASPHRPAVTDAAGV